MRVKSWKRFHASIYRGLREEKTGYFITTEMTNDEELSLVGENVSVYMLSANLRVADVPRWNYAFR